MQKTIQYRNWLITTTTPAAPPPQNTNFNGDVFNYTGSMRELVSENAVVVFARRGCCMCHVVKLLLNGHGVHPLIFHVDEHNESGVINELSKIVDPVESEAASQFPAVFIGGKLFGGLEEVMGAHISGELVPKLREARALWL